MGSDMLIQKTQKMDIQVSIAEIAKPVANSSVEPVVALRVLPMYSNERVEHEMQSIIARVQVCNTILLHFGHLKHALV